MKVILISCCCILFLSQLAYAGVCKDDFEDGNANGWDEVAGDWEVKDGFYVQLGADSGLRVPRTIIQSPWDFTDGSIEVTILYDAKSDGKEIPTILYRMIDKDNGYAFRINGNLLEVGRFVNNIYDDIRGDSFPIEIDKPCRMKLVVEDIFTKVYYNDVIKIRVGEPEPKNGFQKGKIGLAVFDANKPVYFDNVIIQGPGISPFAAMDQAVKPVQKLAFVWGGIK